MITVNQYRTDAEGTTQLERSERVRSNRAADARIRRWVRELGFDPADLDEADTEYGTQQSLNWDESGEPGWLLWETAADSLVG